VFRDGAACGLALIIVLLGVARIRTGRAVARSQPFRSNTRWFAERNHEPDVIVNAYGNLPKQSPTRARPCSTPSRTTSAST